MAILRIVCSLGVAVLAATALDAAEDPVPAERESPPPVAITFTPPDLEGRIVLGIFDESGELVRTLRPRPGTPELRIETNGYVTEWDGRDEAGADCPPGRYSARGLVVGDAVEILGEAYHFNDWVAEDGLPVTDVRLGPGMWVEVTVAGEERPRTGAVETDGTLRWESNPPSVEAVSGSMPMPSAPNLPVEPVFWTEGRAGTLWTIVKDGAQNVVSEISAEGEALREFREPADEPQPVELRASADDDAILLREVGPGGVVRVRLLRKTGRTEELQGRAVSDWEVAFERSMQPCAKFGIEDGRPVAEGGVAPSDAVEVALIPNTLETGPKPLRIAAVRSGAGSALATPGGLEILPVTTQGNWERFALVKDGGELRLFQGNGVGVEEFVVRNPDQIARFDAGAFLLARRGE